MSRIIAGSHRGRRLTMPPGDRTRPTTDRVREALFSALASWVGTSAGPVDQALAGLAFLDLFAGSGAVGLEAASRGAGPVLLVEADARTAKVTIDNARTLGLGAQVRTGKVETVLAQPAPEQFDLVYVDPPYDLATSAMDAVLVALVEQGWVADDGLVVLERSKRTDDPSPHPAYTDVWTKKYGETRLVFCAR